MTRGAAIMLYRKAQDAVDTMNGRCASEAVVLLVLAAQALYMPQVRRHGPARADTWAADLCTNVLIMARPKPWTP